MFHYHMIFSPALTKIRAMIKEKFMFEKQKTKDIVSKIKDYCKSKINPNTRHLDDYELGFVKGEEDVAEEILWIIEQFEKENN